MSCKWKLTSIFDWQVVINTSYYTTADEEQPETPWWSLQTVSPETPLIQKYYYYLFCRLLKLNALLDAICVFP